MMKNSGKLWWADVMNDDNCSKMENAVMKDGPSTLSLSNIKYKNKHANEYQLEMNRDKWRGFSLTQRSLPLRIERQHTKEGVSSIKQINCPTNDKKVKKWKQLFSKMATEIADNAYRNLDPLPPNISSKEKAGIIVRAHSRLQYQHHNKGDKCSEATKQDVSITQLRYWVHFICVRCWKSQALLCLFEYLQRIRKYAMGQIVQRGYPLIMYQALLPRHYIEKYTHRVLSNEKDIMEVLNLLLHINSIRTYLNAERTKALVNIAQTKDAVRNQVQFLEQAGTILSHHGGANKICASIIMMLDKLHASSTTKKDT